MKHFEEEYRKYVHENTPDLWGRIEAGLTEKTEKREQTTARRVPDNWQVIESRLEDRPARRDDIQYKKPNTRRYLQGILTATAGLFIIGTAALTLNMRQKSVEVEQNTMTAYPKEEAAYESSAQQPPAAAINADATPESVGTTEENDGVDYIMSIDSEANGLSAEESADDIEEDMIESEAGEYYEEESADEETIAAAPVITIVPIEELGIALALPWTPTSRPLTTEEEEQGYICEYTGTAIDGITPILTARYIHTEAETLDEYKTILEEDNAAADLKSATYNGIDFLEYTREDQKTYCMLYFAENGTPVELSVTPATPEFIDNLHTVYSYSVD